MGDVGSRERPKGDTQMTSTNTTFHASTTDLTVYATDSHGERYDLNATGEPCADLVDLRNFVQALCVEGYYDADQRDILLGSIASHAA